jgi:hypothetical protein
MVSTHLRRNTRCHALNLVFLKIATATLFVTTVRRRVTSLDDPSIGKFQPNFILVDLPLPL